MIGIAALVPLFMIMSHGNVQLQIVPLMMARAELQNPSTTCEKEPLGFKMQKEEERKNGVFSKAGRRIRRELNLVLGARDERASRVMFCRRLGAVASFITTHHMTGGTFNDQGEFYVKTYDGIYLYYNFSDDKYTIGDGQGLDFRPVRTEQPLEDFLIRSLANEMVYFDVGANNGYYYALKVAKRYPTCSVYAFEPDPRIFLHLTKNIVINQAGSVTPIREALSDHTGVARMTALLGASNFLIPKRGRTNQRTLDVKCTTLDAFVTQHRIQRIDWIKVDIEGVEPLFLQGSGKTLQRFKPIMIMELNPVLLARNDSSVEEVSSLLAEWGYESLHVKDSADAIAIPREKLSLLTKSENSWLEERRA